MAYVQSDKVNKAEKDYYSYLNGNKPGEFFSEYTAKAKDALAEYENRGEFKYNPATDKGYQAARKQYTAGGQQAMKDTLGTATELTGGYDNSYAQAAAQQTYNGYMAELASLMPQYEQQAYGRWQDQGQQMIDYYGILKNAEATDYGMHRDKVGDYYTNADRLYGQWQDAYAADYGMYRDNVADQQYADEIAYRDRRDAIEDQRYADEWALTQEQWAHQQAQDAAANEQWWAQYYSSQASADVDEPEIDVDYPEITDKIYDEFAEAYKKDPKGMTKTAAKYELLGYNPEEIQQIMETVINSYGRYGTYND